MFTLLELSVSGALDFYFQVFTFTEVIVTPSYFLALFKSRKATKFNVRYMKHQHHSIVLQFTL